MSLVTTSQVFEPDVQYQKRSPVPVSLSTIAKKYAVIIDAGSSGSRVQVFSWSDSAALQQSSHAANSTVLNSVPKITQDPKLNLKITPGISSFAGKTNKLWSNHLSKLISHAEKGVPKDLRHETPIYLLATAGMRLLPLQDQKEILNKSCSILQEKSDFYLPHCGSHVSIIDGETEALYGWISLNYLLGTFNGYSRDEPLIAADSISPTKLPSIHPSYGFMDMGGASMQVAFSPNLTESERHLNDLYHVRLRNVDGKNQDWKVFVSTWLGFGANEAKQRFAKYLIAHSKSQGTIASPIPDPCYPKGTLRSFSVDANTTVAFSGAGNLEKCLEAMQPLLRKHVPCKDDPCLFNGVHVPAIDFATDRFVGVSEYWYTANDIFKLGGKYDFPSFSRHVNTYCGSDWKDIIQLKKGGKLYKGVTESALESACFKASWVINILHSGFGLPLDTKEAYGLDSYSTLTRREFNDSSPASFRNLNKRDMLEFVTPFQSASSIEGTELTWTLGRAVLYASSQVPAISPRLPDVGFLPADMTENHYVLGGEILGAPKPIIPSVSSPFGTPMGFFFIFACLIAMLYYFYAKHKRGFAWASNKFRVVRLPKFLSLALHKLRRYPDNSYQRVLEEGTGFPMGLGSPTVSLPATFHSPVSAKSTSMLDLSKLADDNTPVNRVPSRPPSRANSRLNLDSLRDEQQGFLNPSDVGISITRSSSRLFQTQSVERLPLMRS